MSIYEILNYLFLFFFGFILIPIGVAIYRWKVLSTSDKYVFFFLVSLLSVEIVSDILYFSHKRNLFTYYFHTFFSVLFSSLFFFQIINQNILKKVLAFVSLFIIIFIPIEVIFIVGFNQINTLSETFSFVNIIIFAGILIKKMLKQKNNNSISGNSQFWYLTAFFVLGIFSVSTSLFKKQFIESSLDLYYFFDMLTVIGSATSFVLFAFGFWILRKNK